MNGVNASYARAAFCYLVNAVVLTAEVYFVGLLPVEMFASLIPKEHSILIAWVVLEVAFAFLTWMLLWLMRKLEDSVFKVRKKAVCSFLKDGSGIITNKSDLEAYRKNASSFFNLQRDAGQKVDFTEDQSERFFNTCYEYIHKMGQGAACDRLYGHMEYLCLTMIELFGLCIVAIIYACVLFFSGNSALIARPMVAAFVFLAGGVICIWLYKSAVKAWVWKVQAVYDVCVNPLGKTTCERYRKTS